MSALSNITVLDLSRVLAGPSCTQNLADLGVTVIKVEKPGRGDDTRAWGPPFLEHAQGRDASYFLAANRGKKSVAIDMATVEGQDLIRSMAAKADVLVENYKVGGLKKYGLDFDTLGKSNPKLVYCSITGFGQDGPYAPQPGYDFLVQAMGGLMSVTGEADGLPGAGPQKAGIAVADLATGLYATSAILAALLQRVATGSGQHIDISLLDVQVAMMSNQALQYLVSGDVPGRLGNGHNSIVPYQSFRTQDGHLIIAVGNDSQFAKLAAELSHPEWAQDSRFATNSDRVAYRAELVTLIETETLRRSSRSLLAGLNRHGVPCGPINDLARTFNDPQVVARGLHKTIERDGQSIPTLASPLRLSASPVQYLLPPPRLGEHTDEVLGAFLRLRPEQIERLKTGGIVQ